GMRHGRVAPTLHVDAPSTRVDWSAGSLDLVTDGTAWPQRLEDVGGPRRGAVSGFGISGTNAHVVLEAPEPPPEAQEASEAPEPPPTVSAEPVAWTLSAADGAGVARAAARLADAQGRAGDAPVAVAQALTGTRATHRHRAAVTGRDRAELVAGCHALADGAILPPTVARGVARPGPVVFVFPGQGAQWAGMAADLAATSEVFAARLEECSAAAAPYLSFSLADRVRAGVSQQDLGRSEIGQPLLWAVMVSLAAVWEGHRVHADAVIGHSQAENVAACGAGALSLEDSAAVVALRARAVAELMPDDGGMATVALSAEATEELVARWPGRLSVAAYNGPE